MGEVIRGPTVGPLIIGVLRNAQVVDPCPDPPRSKGVQEGVALDAAAAHVHLDREEMQPMSGTVLGRLRQADGEPPKGIHIALPDLLPTFPAGFDAGELVET